LVIVVSPWFSFELFCGVLISDQDPLHRYGRNAERKSITAETILLQMEKKKASRFIQLAW
jgi:hypothetical protein